MKNKIKIVTLGCSKNLVDSEVFSGQIVKYNNGIEISPDFDEADAIIINTCGFINSSREESVNTILEAVEEKNEGTYKKVYVMGCMSEKYKLDLSKSIPELDRIYGLKEFSKMTDEIAKDLLPIKTTSNKNQILKDDKNYFIDRISLEQDHTAYIRISDGCNHRCSYCSIPSMRGNYISRTIEDVLSEVKTFADANVKEFIIIGQEITSYGMDIYGGERKIYDLIKEMSNIVGKDRWIRLMYTHPIDVDEKFIKIFKNFDNVCNYIDFPIEHSETEILKKMFRRDTRESLIEKINLMRSIVPDITIRTSLILGFPTETRKNYLGLKNFVSDMKLDRVGCFSFSLEEDTKAALLPQKPSKATAEKRVAEIMDLQQEISYTKNMLLIGNIEKVLIDRIDGKFSIGRTFRDAPGIDNEVLVEEILEIGEFYSIKIIDAVEFDLYGELT